MSKEKNLVTTSDTADEMSIKYMETIAIDTNGEIVFDILKRTRWQNGSGFMISYADKLCNLAIEAPHGSILRVFLYIAHNQQYGNDNKHFGYSCSKTYLQEKLGISRKSVYNALKWLKEKFIIHEGRVDGQLEFMVNPEYVTIGINKKKRQKEWKRRWEEP